MKYCPALPIYLESKFKFHGFRTVRIQHLFVGLRPIAGGNARYVSVNETPHCIFVRHILYGEPLRSVHGYTGYGHYISINPHPCTEEVFIELTQSVVERGYQWDISPILVVRSWRRPWPICRWDVMDGFHRLAILAALNEKSLKVATLKPKKPILQQVMDRLRGKIHV